MSAVKEQMTGLAGTVVIHLVILLFLLFYYITPTLSRSSEELEGVPVMFGNVPDAGGDDEPAGNSETVAPNQEAVSPNAVAQPQEVNTPSKAVTPAPVVNEQKTAVVKNNTQNVYSQDNEEVAAVAAAKKAAAEKIRQEALAAEQLKREQAEAHRKAQEQARQSAAIKNQTSGLFGKGTGSGSRGEGSGKGTQGVPTGNSNTGKTSGVGGTGSYDLGGRGVGSGGLVLPSYNVDDYGTVVVDIIVDPKGNVVEATVGKGTKTSNATLLSEAMKAARKTKFAAANIAGNQKGTITYKFNLR